MSARTQQNTPQKDNILAAFTKNYGSLIVQLLLTLIIAILAWNVNKFDERLTELEKWRHEYSQTKSDEYRDISVTLSRIDERLKAIQEKIKQQETR